MIERDIRFGDPHHYYHVRAKDQAQFERVKAYIRDRIVAHDPNLERAPAIDGARISTVRRVPRVAGSQNSRQRGGAPRPAPSPSAIRRYGSLAWEGGKRGVVDTAALAADAAGLLAYLSTYNPMALGVPAEVTAAYRSPHPGWGDHVQRKAEQFGLTHPNIKANTTAERYVLDGSRFIGASIVPVGGWEAAGARTLARAGAGAVKLLAGAAGSVGGGDLAEHFHLPRIAGELPGGLLGIGLPSLAGTTTRLVREEAATRAAANAMSPEQAYRAVQAARIKQDLAHQAAMRRLIEKEQKLKLDNKLRLDGLIMADALPRLLKRSMTGEEILFLKKAGLDDLLALKNRPWEGGPRSIREFVDSTLDDWRYKSALKHHAKSFEELFLRQHPELKPALRVINRGPFETNLSRAPYPAKSPAQIQFEKTGRYPRGTVVMDYTGYPVDHVPLPPERLSPRTDAAYEKARSQADRYNRRIREKLGIKGPTNIELHEIVPIKWGGDPFNPANRIPLATPVHRRVVNPWWETRRFLQR